MRLCCCDSTPKHVLTIYGVVVQRANTVVSLDLVVSLGTDLAVHGHVRIVCGVCMRFGSHVRSSVAIRSPEIRCGFRVALGARCAACVWCGGLENGKARWAPRCLARLDATGGQIGIR